MPRTSLPPTPASSLDIHGKDPPPYAVREAPISLPSPAMASASSNGRSARPQPIRPATEKPNFSLPPPPTRSRKIIQMKPVQQQKPIESSAGQSAPSKNSGRKNAIQTSHGAGRKPPSSTSAAGKKMARKTAHSVIERRRRSKMNEEFAVLKDMIPACKDQDMHKLAILSASIEYLRYLEQCVSNLKAVNSSVHQPSPPTLKTSFSAYHDDREDQEEEDDDDDDQDMEDTPTEVPYSASSYQSPHSAGVSPALSALHTSSSYASSVATLPSPAFGPDQYSSNYAHSASTSPTILPNSADADHEATAALLMLNKDRRDKKGVSTSGRSMSVKDLLSPV